MSFHLSNYINIFLRRTKGQKRNFLFAGIINILISNIFLQIFLITGIISLSASTFFTQIINMCLGYFIYSKRIFYIIKYFQIKFILKYFILMMILWQLNLNSIKYLIFIGISKSIAALIIIPLIALISFLFQRFWVFKI